MIALVDNITLLIPDMALVEAHSLSPCQQVEPPTVEDTCKPISVG